MFVEYFQLIVTELNPSLPSRTQKFLLYRIQQFEIIFAGLIKLLYLQQVTRSVSGMLKTNEQALLNSLIYCELHQDGPTRNEMIKYSTWRIYLYNQLQSISTDRRDAKRNLQRYSTQFPQLAISEERKQFYDFLYRPIESSSKKYKDDLRNDNISHFICRMLYCQEEATHQTFIEIQRRILEGRLRGLLRDNNASDRGDLMDKLKKILAIFKTKESSSYHVPLEQWVSMRESISFSVLVNQRKEEEPRLYAKLPFQEAEAGIRKRRSFIKGGFVYVNTESMLDIVLSNYEQYLKRKLEKVRPVVQDLIVEDVQNQFASFLISTIKQINEEGMDETKMNGKFNLTLRNIQALTKFFPPCMLHLNQQLKIHRHLKHDGRRQLWGFFKACGMDVHDNKEYFRKHLEGKVTASQMKTHMYNIEHAYGLQGKKKVENAWKCRNIITGTAPKKDEHHGCPFYHWRSGELAEFLRKNYQVTEDKLKQIISEKEEKHFQVACGRLFESARVNQNDGPIPPEITAKMGRAPYLYYEAGMELRERNLKEKDAKEMKPEDRNSIQF